MTIKVLMITGSFQYSTATKQKQLLDRKITEERDEYFTTRNIPKERKESSTAKGHQSLRAEIETRLLYYEKQCLVRDRFNNWHETC